MFRHRDDFPRKRGGHIIGVFLMVLLAIGLVAWGGQWLYYRLTHVHVIDARIQADMVSVAARLEGRISTLEVASGSAVEPGQLLLTLDPAEVEQDLQILKAGEQTLLSQIDGKQAQLAMAREVDSSRETIALRTLDTVQADIQQRQLALEKAQTDLARLERMAGKDMVSAQQLADARYQADSAAAALRRDQAELASAQASLMRARAESGQQKVLAAELESLRTSLMENRARQRRLELDIEDHRIVSPIQGVVARTFVEAGEVIKAGQSLMLAYQADRLWVEANVKETAVARVQVGQPVMIRVDAYPDETFPGRVERVGMAATSEFALLPSPNPSGNFTKTTQRIPVRIAFDSPDPRLRPGLMVEVGIDVH